MKTPELYHFEKTFCKNAWNLCDTDYEIMLSLRDRYEYRDLWTKVKNGRASFYSLIVKVGVKVKVNAGAVYYPYYFNFYEAENFKDGDDAPLVDFNRVEVASRNEVKIYITKLITDWVDEILRLGVYMEDGKSKEDEIKDILHDMMFWDDRNPKWTAYDSTDKVNAVWLSQYKTKEDRENLFKEIK